MLPVIIQSACDRNRVSPLFVHITKNETGQFLLVIMLRITPLSSVCDELSTVLLMCSRSQMSTDVSSTMNNVVFHVGDDELGDYVLEEQLGTGDVMSGFIDCVSHIQVQLFTETRVEIEVYLPVTNVVDLLLVCWILCAGFDIAL